MEIRRSLESNFLICRICNKNYNEPKVLACMHTFCKACLDHILEQDKLDSARKRREIEQQQQQHASSSGYSSSTSSFSAYKGRWSRTFKSNGSHGSSNAYNMSRFSEDMIICPICEKKTVLPMSGVHGLADDQLAGKLATIVGRIPNYPVCDVCSNGQGAIYINNVPVAGDLQPNSKSYICTDTEEGNSASECQTTEDEDENASEPTRQNPDVQLTSLRSGRHYMRKTKTRLARSSDGECSKSSKSQPNEAVAACLECSKQLCAPCHRNHSKLSVTADHVIVTLDQLNSMSCPRHPRELKRFFCVTCGELICLVCTFESSISDLNSEDSNQDLSITIGHADHNVLSINQGLVNLQQTINKSIFECKQKAERLNLLLLGLRSCEESSQSIASDINRHADALIQQITEQRLSLLNKLDIDVGVNKEGLAEQCETIMTSLTSWNKIKDEGDCKRELLDLHPVDALGEASIIRNRYLGCLDLLCASFPKTDSWSRLVKEIDGLENIFVEAEARQRSDPEGDEDSNPVTRIKLTKQVRFAPPAEMAGMIPPSHVAHWTRRLGKFISGDGIKLGRRVTPGQLATEAFMKEEGHLSKSVQVSPTDVYGNPLPVERDSRRHRAIQVNLLQANKKEISIQTDPLIQEPISLPMKGNKIDNGTQYQSSDINTPMSFFRSSRQIKVQQ